MLLPGVAFNFTVPEPDYTACVAGNVLFVGDEDNGVACCGECSENIHDVAAGCGIEVSGWLVGKDD